MREADRLRFERDLASQGCRRIAGIDEAGRGPLAGPVVVAAVVLPLRWIRQGMPRRLAGIDDSKRLAPRLREALCQALLAEPGVSWRVRSVSSRQIDRLNILQATRLGMERCLRSLQGGADHVLVDGLRVPSLGEAQTALVRGDSRSYSIAAASILAKTLRDRILAVYDRRYPGYGFARHKGYPTAQHLLALRRLGPAPVHRLSFAPVRRHLDLFAGRR